MHSLCKCAGGVKVAKKSTQRVNVLQIALNVNSFHLCVCLYRLLWCLFNSFTLCCSASDVFAYEMSWIGEWGDDLNFYSQRGVPLQKLHPTRQIQPFSRSGWLYKSLMITTNFVLSCCPDEMPVKSLRVLFQISWSLFPLFYFLTNSVLKARNGLKCNTKVKILHTPLRLDIFLSGIFGTDLKDVLIP